MQAPIDQQQTLLRLQGLDTAVEQLASDRRRIPELEQIATLKAERKRVMEMLISAQARLADQQRALKRAGVDLEPVVQRLERDQQRINSGAITDPKQLSALIDESERLELRVEELSLAQLEAAESVEQTEKDIASQTETRTDLEDRLRTLMKSRDAAAAELDQERQTLLSDREKIVATLLPTLLTAYDKARAQHNGVGAAELKNGRCQGCQIEANSADLQRYRQASEDELLHCEECGRILIRS